MLLATRPPVHDSAIATVRLLPRHSSWRRSASATSEALVIASMASGSGRRGLRRDSVERRERHANEDLGDLLGRLAGRRVRRTDVELVGAAAELDLGRPRRVLAGRNAI